MAVNAASHVRGIGDEAFGTEEQCRAALVRLHWPDGFDCHSCGHSGHCLPRAGGFTSANRCETQTSLTADTIFLAAKLPLTLWFAAIQSVLTAKKGVSSVELGRRLGAKQPTAWIMKQKIMEVMARREGEWRLADSVEKDDAWLGDRRFGKRGRGADGKTPFVAAVSIISERRLRTVKLVHVRGFRKRKIARGAPRWLAPGREAVTDGFGCWRLPGEGAFAHCPVLTFFGLKAVRAPAFKSVNATLGNIKSAITGTRRKIGPNRAEHYLARFAWRYNLRCRLQTMIPRFVHSAARNNPMPCRSPVAG